MRTVERNSAIGSSGAILFGEICLWWIQPINQRFKNLGGIFALLLNLVGNPGIADSSGWIHVRTGVLFAFNHESVEVICDAIVSVILTIDFHCFGLHGGL